MRPLLLAVSLLIATAAPASSDGPGGSSLVEVLERLRDEGLRIVYSSAVVDDAMRVETVPTLGTPRERLAALLAPHGLRVAEGPAGSLLVVRGEPAPSGDPPRVVPSSVFVTEVVVTPGTWSLIGEEPATRRSITGDETVLVPAIGGDTSRAIERLPGVAAQDSSAAFNVRGSTAADVSIVLDGLELYDPYHLQSFHSPFSLIDTSIVDRVDVLGGGFTAELGDRHGGFVEISTLDAEPRARGEIELGTLNSRVTTRGTRGARAWLVSARAWYPEAIRASTELGQGENLDPRFYDLYAKLGAPVGGRHYLSGHGLLAFDRLVFVERGEAINERVDALTRNGYAWARLHSAWSPALSSESVVSGGRIERRRDGLSSEDGAIEVDDDRTVLFVGVRHDVRWRPSERRLVKLGFDLRRLRARYRYAADVRDEPDESRSVGLDPAGTSLGVWAARRMQLGERFALELGARWDRQTYTNDNQLAPRLNAVWRAGPRTELRLALGRFNQSQRIHELDVQDGEERFGRAEASEQAELSWRRRGAAGPSIRLDAYVRRLDDLRPRYENLFEPIELFPETVADRARIAPDEARLRGVELLVRGREERPLVWWVGYTRSTAEDRVDGNRVPRAWDQPHAATFLVGSRGGRRWSLTASGAWRSGWPTTSVVAEPETQPDGTLEFEVVPDVRNGERLPTYFRLDARVRRTIDLRRGRLRLTLEVINLTDRDNLCCVGELDAVPDGEGGAEVRREFDAWLGITPTFSAAWEF